MATTPAATRAFTGTSKPRRHEHTKFVRYMNSFVPSCLRGAVFAAEDLEADETMAAIVDLLERKPGHLLQVVDGLARRFRAVGDPGRGFLAQQRRDALEFHRRRGVQVDRLQRFALEMVGEVV